jgi:hypothetical protein
VTEDPCWLGALQLTVALPDRPIAAVTAVGGLAASTIGATGDESGDAGPLPTLFVAATVKVYGVPLVSPSIVVDDDAGFPVTVSPVHDGHGGDGVIV